MCIFEHIVLDIRLSCVVRGTQNKSYMYVLVVPMPATIIPSEI